MSKYISELMSPQLMGVIYAFVGFIIALYVLSVVYVFIDARRRGAERCDQHALPADAPAAAPGAAPKAEAAPADEAP